MKLPFDTLQKSVQKLLAGNKRSILLLVFWAFMSRGLGVIREGLTGRLSPLEADMFNTAAILNETIVTIFILGGIGVVSLPLISKLQHGEHAMLLTPHERADRVNMYTSWVIIVLMVAVAVCCGVGILYSRDILHLLNPHIYEAVQASGKEGEYIMLNQIFLLAPLLFSIKTVLGVFLNSHKAFAVYSLDGVLANIGSILGLSLLYTTMGIVGTAWGLVLGFLFVVCAFVFDSYRNGFRFTIHTFPELPVYIRHTIILLIPRLFLISSARMAEISISLYGNYEGAVSTTRMGMNIQGVFYGLMVAVGTVMLPDLAKLLHTNGKSTAFWQLIQRYMKSTLFMSSIAMFVTVLGAPLILWLIKTIAFVDQGSLLAQAEFYWQIVILIAIGSLAIIPQSLGEIINRYFITIEANSVPVIANTIGNVLSFVGVLICAQYTHFNIAYVVMVSFVINTCITTGIMYWNMRLHARSAPVL